MNQIIGMKDIKKTYQSRGVETMALNGVNFSMTAGEFVSIMGPSGSGKTTLLNMLATIDQPTAGDIYFKEHSLTGLKVKDLSEYRSNNLGFLFQEYNLVDHLTGFDNIALPLTFDNINHKEIVKKVHEVAHLLKIEDQLTKYPYEMSGGQKQRIATARAIIKNPTIVLADEPTGALDSGSSKDLLNLLEYLNHTMNISILMVTHDPLSASFSSRVVFLKDGKEHSTLHRGHVRERFYNEILDQLIYLGGE
jgi:putative ABC transport system ATP-binding protein